MGQETDRSIAGGGGGRFDARTDDPWRRSAQTDAVRHEPDGAWDRQHHWCRNICTHGPSRRSVGSVGDSYDNALAETINGLYKAEVIHRRGPWRSFETVEFATLTWVDWFNNRRLLQPIGNIPPAEAEARYYAMINEQKLAA